MSEIEKLKQVAEQAEVRYLSYKEEIQSILDELEQLRIEMQLSQDEYRRCQHIDEQAHARVALVHQLPNPFTIASAVKRVREMCADVLEVDDIEAAISVKDSRTVKSYRSLLPELQEALKGLVMIRDALNFD